MIHFHFGAGHFGLGFAVYVAAKANLKTYIFNRESSADGSNADGSVSAFERNEFLSSNTEYSVNYYDADKDQVRYEKFIQYDTEQENQLLNSLTNLLKGTNESFIVTTSLRNLNAYPYICEAIGKTIEQRVEGGILSPAYVIAFENDIRSTEVVTEITKNSSNINDQVLGVEAVVDRICKSFAFSDDVVDGNYQLQVVTENFAQLFLEDIGDSAIKNLFADASDEILVTSSIDLEKTKKKYFVNGIHLILALQSQQYGFANIAEMFDVESYGNSHPSLEERLENLSALIDEYAEAFKYHVEVVFKEQAYLNSTFNNKQEAAYKAKIHERFIRSPDSLERVIQMYGDSGTIDDVQSYILGKFHERVMIPFSEYILRVGRIPARMLQGINSISIVNAKSNFAP